MTGGGSDGARIGTAIVSYMQPHARAELEFNRWYERDHFPAAVLAGPGAYSGARFVATRACRGLRSGGDLFGDSHFGGAYLSLAWLLPGAQPAWDAWIPGQMATLAAEGRMFTSRDHLHTAVYEHLWDAGTLDAPPASLALERRFAGLIAIAVRGDDGTAVWARELVGPHLPVVVALRRQRLLVSVLDEVPAHVLLLAFVDGDPIDVWKRIVVPLLAGGGRAVGFPGPFLATVPGTDTYVDQL